VRVSISSSHTAVLPMDATTAGTCVKGWAAPSVHRVQLIWSSSSVVGPWRVDGSMEDFLCFEVRCHMFNLAKGKSLNFFPIRDLLFCLNFLNLLTLKIYFSHCYKSCHILYCWISFSITDPEGELVMGFWRKKTRRQ
jgi:hypothetical protein